MIHITLPTRARWTGILSYYWRWWVGELTDIIPSRLRTASRARNRLHIHLHEDRLTIEAVVAGNGQQFLTEHGLDKIDRETWQQIANLCTDQEPYILLGEHDYYSVDFDLPRAARGYLRQATSLQISLLSPLNPDLVDWSVIEKRVSRKAVTATLFLAKKSLLDETEDRLRQHEINPSVMGVWLDDNAVALRRFDNQASGTPKILQPRNIYWISLLILLLTPVTIGLAAKVMLAANNSDIAKMERELAGKSAGNRLAKYHEDNRQKVAAISQTPSLGFQLKTISRSLPEDNFVETVSMDQSGQIALEASGTEGSKLAENLSATGLFKNASLAGETKNDDGSTSYTIEAVVK